MAEATFQGTPKWYADYLKTFLDKGFEKANEEYQPYAEYIPELDADGNPIKDSFGQIQYKPAVDEKGQIKYKPRLADRDPLINKIYNKAAWELNSNANPFNHALNQSNLANNSAASGVTEYMSPFTENVIQRMEDKSINNFMEEVAPAISSNFISAGGFNSGARNKFLKNAALKANEDLENRKAELRMQNYNNALELSDKALNRRLSSAELAARLQDSQLDYEEKKLSHAQDAASQKQQYDQTKLDQQYEEYLRSQGYNDRSLDKLHERLRGLPVQTNTGYSPINTATQQQSMSPYSTGGMLLGQMMALRQQASGDNRLFSKGGRVRRAGGGPLQALAAQGMPQQEQNPYMQKLQMAADQLQKSDRDPLWSWFGQTMASGAASGAPNLMSALGQGSKEGYAAAQNTIAQNKSNKHKALDIEGLIEQSRKINEQTMYEREQKAKEFELERNYKMGNLDIAQGSLAEQRRHHENSEQIEKLKLMAQTGQSPNKDIIKKGNEKDYESMLEESRAADNRIGTWNRMEQLVPELGRTQVLGYELPKFLQTGNRAALEEFDALSKTALAQITSTQKGAQSDRDMANWAKTVPALATSNEGKLRIIKSREAIDSRTLEGQTFIDQALEAGIPLNIAKRAFKQWANDNPLFIDGVLGEINNPQTNPEDYLNGSPQISPKTQNTQSKFDINSLSLDDIDAAIARKTGAQ
jgi:hypothetical protein